MKPIRSVDSPQASVRVPIAKFKGTSLPGEDLVIVEEPLEIRLASHVGAEVVENTLSITMRTPGDEFELVTGFLHGEGIIHSAHDIESIEFCGPPSPDKHLKNIVRVRLSDQVELDETTFTRNFYTTSSCGVCGKASLEALDVHLPEVVTTPLHVDESMICSLPSGLKNWQTEFRRTGGLHACALFLETGEIVRVREDVGRHNALDKLIGSYVLQDEKAALTAKGVLLSGRSSFEMVQKAAMANIPLIVAIGPPSSLAIELAKNRNIGLIGFLKADGFNVYHQPDVV